MKILNLGYGIRPYQGGGTLIVTEDLMKDFADRGHDVHYLCPGRFDFTFRTRLTHRKKGNVNIHEILNPPNFILSRYNPEKDISQPVLETLLSNVIDLVDPDVVHLHDFPGWTAESIRILKEFGKPLFIKIGNFWSLCPTLSLFDSTGCVCRDYEDGRKCIKCMGGVTSEALGKLRKRILILASRFRMEKPALGACRCLKSLLKKQARAGGGNLPSSAETQLANSYRIRRASLVSALNLADCIVCSSDRARQILTDHGVNKELACVINPVTRCIERIKPKSADRKVELPVRFCLIGTSIQKGFEVAVTAFRHIDPNKACLRIYGNRTNLVDTCLGRLKATNIYFMGTYKQEQLNQILADVDVGILPSICEDVHPLTGIEFLAAGVPIIASKIGGIGEYMRHNENGLFFEAGDAHDLIQKVMWLIESPERISLFAKNIKRPKNIEQHSLELERLYENFVTTLR